MPETDDLNPTPTDVVSRIDAAALPQLTLLESTIHALRPRLNEEMLSIEDVVTLAHQIGSLSHLMLSWAELLVGRPANAEEGVCDACEEGEW
jgi:hypothetical protein